MSKKKDATIVEAQVEPSLAEKVRGVENELIQAMLEAAKPILAENGYGGFKDVSLLVSKPDEDGNVQQSLRVIV